MEMNVIVVKVLLEFCQHKLQLATINVLAIKHRFVEDIGALIFIRIIVNHKPELN